MNKKYELTNETKNHYGATLYHIKALRDFGNVKKGDLGGWVESEGNLSHDGGCWIYDEAISVSNAVVRDNAVIRGKSIISYNAIISDNVTISQRANITHGVKISDDVAIAGDISISGGVKISGKVNILGVAEISGKVVINGDMAMIGVTNISGDAIIQSREDYIVFKNNWSSNRHFTWTKSNNMWSVGCFYGTGEELIKKAYKDSRKSGKMYEKYVNFVKELQK